MYSVEIERSWKLVVSHFITPPCIHICFAIQTNRKVVLETNMVYNNNFCLAWPAFMCIMTVPFVSSKLVTSTYLQFSNQTEVPLNEATNFVTLNSVDLVRLPSKRFTLCGSIFIRYFRSSQSFYTVRHSAQDKLWLSLAIENQEIKEERYTPVVYRFGSASVSNTGARLSLYRFL